MSNNEQQSHSSEADMHSDFGKRCKTEFFSPVCMWNDFSGQTDFV